MGSMHGNACRVWKYRSPSVLPSAPWLCACFGVDIVTHNHTRLASLNVARTVSRTPMDLAFAIGFGSNPHVPPKLRRGAVVHIPKHAWATSDHVQQQHKRLQDCKSCKLHALSMKICTRLYFWPARFWHLLRRRQKPTFLHPIKNLLPARKRSCDDPASALGTPSKILENRS